MKTLKLLFFITLFISFGCKDKSENTPDTSANMMEESNETTQMDMLEIDPISHATMILSYGDATIYVDPTGGADAFKGKAKPTFVLITDIHGDHMDAETLKTLDLSNATLIVPSAVLEQLPELNTKETMVLNNGEKRQLKGMDIEAIPMYNLRTEALKFHEKGRGNGYVLTLGMERIYISGDTEDIPEMRNLKDIDVAFVCMNLPYTMTVESAASAVLDFKPKKVYPYHYRGTNGFSDVSTFKKLVNKGSADIEVVQLNWYK